VAQHSDRTKGNSVGTADSRGNDAGSALLSPRAFAIREFCRRYSVGRTRAYQEIATGRLRAVKVGRRTLITYDDAEAWLAALPDANYSHHRDRQ
jgi:excisionase family DNA binding protein